VGTDLASKLRGYPEGEVEKAKVDHAERAKRILAAQTNMTARGIMDLGNDPAGGRKEKDDSQNPDLDDSGHRNVRGEE